MTHTNDIGVAIADGLDGDELPEHIDLFDWENSDTPVIGRVNIQSIDASHGFSDLRVTTTDGAEFRVSITRI